MIRTVARVVAVSALLSFEASAGASAQIAPGDSGAGTKLGLAELDNSGEVGAVTLLPRGPSSTLVVIGLSSEPPGRAQPARIDRGRDCSATGFVPAYRLAPVVNGTSQTIVNVPESKLLSGNYVVTVHAAAAPGGGVSCGELYS